MALLASSESQIRDFTYLYDCSTDSSSTKFSFCFPTFSSETYFTITCHPTSRKGSSSLALWTTSCLWHMQKSVLEYINDSLPVLPSRLCCVMVLNGNMDFCTLSLFILFFHPRCCGACTVHQGSCVYSAVRRSNGSYYASTCFLHPVVERTITILSDRTKDGQIIMYLILNTIGFQTQKF